MSKEKEEEEEEEFIQLTTVIDGEQQTLKHELKLTKEKNKYSKLISS